MKFLEKIQNESNENNSMTPLAQSVSRKSIMMFGEALFSLVGAFVLGLLIASGETASAGSAPPFLIAVVIMAVHRGVVGGLLTAGLATVFFYWGGIPEALASQTFYEYRASLVIQPVLWASVGLLVGALTSRLTTKIADLSAQFEEMQAKALVLANAVEDMKNRNLQLERRIVSEDNTFNTLLKNMPIPASESTQDVLIAAEPFLSSGFGEGRVGVYFRKNSGFERIAGSGPTHFLDLSEVNELGGYDNSNSERPFLVETISSGEEDQVHGLVVVEYDREHDDPEDIQVTLRKTVAGFAGYLDSSAVSESEISSRKAT